MYLIKTSSQFKAVTIFKSVKELLECDILLNIILTDIVGYPRLILIGYSSFTNYRMYAKMCAIDKDILYKHYFWNLIVRLLQLIEKCVSFSF